MNLTEKHTIMASQALAQSVKRGFDYIVYNYTELPEWRDLDVSDNDVAVVRKVLINEGLIETSPKDEEVTRVTILGIEVIDMYKSYSGYIEHLKKEVENRQYEEKKEQQFGKVKAHLVYLQVAKHWITLLTLIISIGANIYFYFDVSSLKESLKKEESSTTPITDTIQQQKQTTLKE